MKSYKIKNRLEGVCFFNESTYKPSSVIDDYLSRKAVANLLKPLFTAHRANVLP